jgi:hypothetical protein
LHRFFWLLEATFTMEKAHHLSSPLTSHIISPMLC